MRTHIAGSVFAALLVASVAHAQSGGTVTGLVADETGGVLPGVTVDLRSGATELSVVTDAIGRYRLEDVPAGAAEVSFKLINFTVCTSRRHGDSRGIACRRCGVDVIAHR